MKTLMNVLNQVSDMDILIAGLTASSDISVYTAIIILI